MREQMDDLEIRLSYLHKMVEELNVVVIEKQKELRELGRVVKILGQKIREMSSPQMGFDPDEKPPHY